MNTKRKRARKGESLLWLISQKHYSGSDCLKFPYAKKGYGLVYVNGKGKCPSRIMCSLAHGEPPTPKHKSSHSCGNGHLGCVNPNHLSWKTHSKNEQDKRLHGTYQVGENNHRAILTERDVMSIFNEPYDTLDNLARRYGVAPTTIHEIRTGKSWQHLTSALLRSEP